MGNVTKNDTMSMKELEFVAIQFIVKFTVIWTWRQVRVNL